MVPSQKGSKRRRRRKRFSNYVPEDFDQKVPFLIRKIEEEEEPQDFQNRDSLTEAVKIHWVRKGESEEEWTPSIDGLEENFEDVLNSTEQPKKSESTVEESVSLYSYVPEPEPEPEVVEVEENPGKKKDRNKKLERIAQIEAMEMSELDTVVGPEGETTLGMGVESDGKIKVESLGYGDMGIPVKVEPEGGAVSEAVESEIVLKSEVEFSPELEPELVDIPEIKREPEWEEESEWASKPESVQPELVDIPEIKREPEWEEESEWAPKSESETLPQWETKTIEKLAEESESKYESEATSKWELQSIEEEGLSWSEDDDSGELVVETEEIKFKVVDPQVGEEPEDELETEPSYTWLLGPTFDEAILDVVDFVSYVARFVKDPIGFGKPTKHCCKMSELCLSDSDDDNYNEED